MRQTSSQHYDALELNDTTTLLWRYEVSDDGGKSWQPEDDWNDSGAYVLRRGNWVAPAIN